MIPSLETGTLRKKPFVKTALPRQYQGEDVKIRLSDSKSGILFTILSHLLCMNIKFPNGCY